MQDVTRFSSDEHHLSDDKTSIESEEKFVPKGAITFFLLMIFVFALMWFSIYFELIQRS